jgi:hypothetical protein
MTRVFPKAAQLILLILFTACFPIQIILQSKSPSEFAANFVYWRHPFIFKVKAAGLDKELNGRISSADDPVDYIWGYAGKQMVVFVISFAIFIVSCAFIVKPITVRDYWRVRF